MAGREGEHHNRMTSSPSARHEHVNSSLRRALIREQHGQHQTLAHVLRPSKPALPVSPLRSSVTSQLTGHIAAMREALRQRSIMVFRIFAADHLEA